MATATEALQQVSANHKPYNGKKVPFKSSWGGGNERNRHRVPENK